MPIFVPIKLARAWIAPIAFSKCRAPDPMIVAAALSQCVLPGPPATLGAGIARSPSRRQIPCN